MLLSFDITTEYHTKRIPFFSKKISLWAIGLNEVPEELKDCKILECIDLSTNSLKAIKHLSALPMLYNINLDYNQLHSLDGLPKSSKVVAARRNLLGDDVQAPAGVEALYLSFNMLTKPPKTSKALKILHIGNNPLKTLNGLKEGLEEVELSVEFLESQPKPLPKSVKRLILCGKPNKNIDIVKMLPLYLESVQFERDCSIHLPITNLINSGGWAQAQRKIDSAVAERNFLLGSIPVANDLRPVPAIVIPQPKYFK